MTDERPVRHAGPGLADIDDVLKDPETGERYWIEGFYTLALKNPRDPSSARLLLPCLPGDPHINLLGVNHEGVGYVYRRPWLLDWCGELSWSTSDINVERNKHIEWVNDVRQRVNYPYCLNPAVARQFDVLSNHERLAHAEGLRRTRLRIERYEALVARDTDVSIEVKDIVVVNETGRTAEVTGFFRHANADDGNRGTTEMTACLPDDPDLAIIKVCDDMVRFVRPWDVTWSARPQIAAEIVDIAKMEWRLENVTSYLFGQFRYESGQFMDALSAHQRMRVAEWRREVRAAIVEADLSTIVLP
ncbi:hypothetical protein ACOI1H_19745 [Loktanella sp. DJP18]|uniref:hypothetical protein n=1 Tax=Loktanella sp. DJP18 TaxID=3409788 RepID=UPI003BB69936